MNTYTHETRRRFLKGVGAIGTVSLAGAGTAAARGRPTDAPNVDFEPDSQDALVLPENPAPLEAAVQTKNVHMPDGGWVVIFEGVTPVGQSIHKLPAGHFKNLKVATLVLESGEHFLVATIVHGENLDDAVQYTDDQGNPIVDMATVTYP